MVKVHAQVAVLQHRGDFLFLLDGCFGHADDPRRVLSHGDVPGALARGEALAAQHAGVGVVPLGVVGQLLLLLAVMDAGEVV